MASSGPMIASTFWKNTIPLCTGCDQSTACSSSWWSAKLPAVWKNFFGTIGARSLTCASGSRSPVSPAWPPRSNHSRVEAQSSSTTTPSWPSPSRRPTRSASKVTSFMAVDSLSFYESSFRLSSCEDGRGVKRGGRGGDAEHAQLERERGVVADEGEQLEQPGRADAVDRPAVLGVVQVAPRHERGGRARD